MTLFEAPKFDPKRDRRRAILLWSGIAAVLIIAVLVWLNRFWPQERVVKNFFAALETKDFNQAYGIWIADSDWQQHPDQHKQYLFNDFYRDWGPGGEWGVIRSHHVDGSMSPGNSTGVIVVVTLNERKEQARVWVEKKDKSLTFSPF